MNQISESIFLALQAIWANKLRSLMTVLGNIVAVTSIVTVVSLIQGMNAYVSDTIVSGVGVRAVRALKRAQVFIVLAEQIRRGSERLELLAAQCTLALGTRKPPVRILGSRVVEIAHSHSPRPPTGI